MATARYPSAVPATKFAARALMDIAEEVAAALLGTPFQVSRHEHRWGRHGSLSLQLSGSKRGLWFDHERGEGGDMLLLIARERQVGLIDAVAIAQREFLGLSATGKRSDWKSEPQRSKHTETRVAMALRLWSEAAPITNSLGERYFVEHRQLNVCQIDIGHAVKWHGSTRALIALMTDPGTGRPTGVHRTFLDASANKLTRRMLGRQGVVRLSPDESVTTGLGITEGVEDAIAALISGWYPVWAVTSAGAVARFPVLSGIEALTIFADADHVGVRSAESCRLRWRDARREVRIVSPGGSNE